ncbi:protein peste-like isoform X1 [Tenebrio molitor]|uniref:protein peste-like isoform X1 n=1 Tax=Tenebrio molitor TaxID=7067 RepID=UPI0036249EA1
MSDVKQKRLCVLSASLLMIITGTLLIFSAPVLLKFIIRSMLVLKPGTHMCDVWEHFPDPVPTDMYLFNWTNPEEIRNKSVKPRFQQVGPYRFTMDVRKSNITWNDNGTVTFRQLKYWYYNREDSGGDLHDKVTTLHLTALGVSHVSRTWNYMVRKGVSLSLRGITSTVHFTHTVEELLFKGYPDTLMKIAKTFPFFVNVDIPQWDRFGWLYMRNGSTDFDGVYNIKTGIDSEFGRLNTWNYWTQTPYFSGQCGKIDGFVGDAFDPDLIEKTIKVFSPEMCRPVYLQYEGKKKVKGIIGHKYSFDDYMIDNGTKYPENKCFCNGDCFPSGVFNVSSCRYGIPGFGSLPHFYKADPHYTNSIEGMQPKKEKHEFYAVLEPNTGVPLEVRINTQINVYLHSIPDISLFENIPEVLVPALWIDQRFKIPDSEVSKLKLLLNVPVVCTSIGILMIIVGLISSIYYIVKSKKNKYLHQENVPLNTVHQNKIVS